MWQLTVIVGLLREFDEQIIVEMVRRFNDETLDALNICLSFDFLNWYLHDGSGSFAAITEAVNRGCAENSDKTLFVAEWEEIVRTA